MTYLSTVVPFLFMIYSQKTLMARRSIFLFVCVIYLWLTVLNYCKIYSIQICDIGSRTLNPVSRSLDSEYTCLTHGPERRRHLSLLIKTPSPALTRNYRSTVAKNPGQGKNGAGRKVRRVQPQKKRRKVDNSWVNFLSPCPVGMARLLRERRERE